MKNLKKKPLIYKLLAIVVGICIVMAIAEFTIGNSGEKIKNNDSEDNYPVHHDCRY